MQRDNWRRQQYEREYYNTNDRSRNLDFQSNQHFSRDRFQNNSRDFDNPQYKNSRRFDKGYKNYFQDRNPSNSHYNRRPYDRPQNRHFNHHENKRQTKTTFDRDEDLTIPSSPLELKINKLVNAVQEQVLIGELVFIVSEKDNSTIILQNAAQSAKNYQMNVILNSVTNKFELSINGQVLGETDCNKGKQLAKNELCKIVLQDLKKKCFYITRKDNFEEVQTGEPKKEETQPKSSFEGSKAYNMMLKMGWGGKGLGVQEQGEQKTVADKMVKNITKEGLGTKNVIAEVDQILQDYISSSKITTLAFDSSFSKEERAQIHNFAQKYNLKSKSFGKEPDRRITISRKLAKWDLVKELLRSNLENDSYKLSIPENFENLWEDDN